MHMSTNKKVIPKILFNFEFENYVLNNVHMNYVHLLLRFQSLLLSRVTFKKQPPEVFYKKAVLKNFAIFRGKTLCWSLFLINVAGHPATLNETPTQAFSCGYCKIFQNIFFEEHIQKATPGVSWFSSICVASSYKETTPPVLKLDWIQLLNI